MGVSIQTYRVKIGTFQPKYCIRTPKTNQVTQVHIDIRTTFLLVVLIGSSLPIFVHLNQDSFDNKIQHPATTSFDPSTQVGSKPGCCSTSSAISPTSWPPTASSSTPISAPPWCSSGLSAKIIFKEPKVKILATVPNLSEDPSWCSSGHSAKIIF